MAIGPGAATPVLAVRSLAGAGEGLPICLLTPSSRPLRHGAARLVEQLLAVILASGEPMPAFDVQDRPGGVAAAH
jgi:hypothetical protein